MTPELFALDVELPAEPLLLARRIWDQRCPALLWTQVGQGPSYVLCNPDQESEAYDPEPALELEPAAGSDARAPRWLGVLPYEAERSRLERTKYTPHETREEPLVARRRWWRYPAVARVEHGAVRLLGQSEGAVRELLGLLQREHAASLDARLEQVPKPDAEVQHRERIEAALARIFDGELYEVNLARRIELTVEGNALGILAKTSRFAQAEYAAALVLPCGAEVVSTSPELVLELLPTRVARTVPIKGTRPRGASAEQDEITRRELDQDPKERAELAMVVDLERNDLGSVAETGSVRAGQPYITTHTSIFHREAEVSAKLLEGLGREQLLKAMLPSGSVTGAPKVRAMELIRELEAERRGLYTGAFGFIEHGGGMKLAMAIRTLVRRGALAHYFVGGGIVADSEPEREVQETGWKALQVTRALE